MRGWGWVPYPHFACFYVDTVDHARPAARGTTVPPGAVTKRQPLRIVLPNAAQNGYSCPYPIGCLASLGLKHPVLALFFHASSPMYIILTRSLFISYVMSDLCIPTCYCIPKANRLRGQKRVQRGRNMRATTPTAALPKHTPGTRLSIHSTDPCTTHV